MGHPPQELKTHKCFIFYTFDMNVKTRIQNKTLDLKNLNDSKLKSVTFDQPEAPYFHDLSSFSL